MRVQIDCPTMCKVSYSEVSEVFEVNKFCEFRGFRQNMKLREIMRAFNIAKGGAVIAAAQDRSGHEIIFVPQKKHAIYCVL